MLTSGWYKIPVETSFTFATGFTHFIRAIFTISMAITFQFFIDTSPFRGAEKLFIGTHEITTAFNELIITVKTIFMFIANFIKWNTFAGKTTKFVCLTVSRQLAVFTVYRQNVTSSTSALLTLMKILEHYFHRVVFL